MYCYYKECNSLRKTASKYKINREVLTKEFRVNGLVINESTRNKHELNENFFEDIDTEEKAYWLGFIYADGYIGETNSMRIELKLDDKEHLNKLIKAIEGTYTVKDRADKNTCYLNVNNKKLASDLRAVGLYANKSMTITFPLLKETVRYTELGRSRRE